MSAARVAGSARRPRALVTNDDGIGATGLHVLAAAARETGFDVLVAAPHEERSGASASLSALVDDRLRVRETRTTTAPGSPAPAVPAVAVEASPALIVLLAAHGAFGEVPDVVLSGVNHGPNAGQAVLHSGTVGAAATGLSHGIPAAAFSLAVVGRQHGAPADDRAWETVRTVLLRVLPWLRDGWAGQQQGVLNVNVPDVPPERLRGLREAPLAPFGAVQAEVGEREGEHLAVTFSAVDAEPDRTDAGLLRDGWVTVTGLRPLQALPPDGLATLLQPSVS